MAVQIIIPFTSLLGKAAISIFKNWRGILALTGLVVTTGLSIRSMISEMGQTALSLWPLLALCFFFLLLKEFVRAWQKITVDAIHAGKES